MTQLKRLIDDALNANNLSREELVSRLGYTNRSKGFRRLGDFLKNLEDPAHLAPKLDDILFNGERVIQEKLEALRTELRVHNFKPFLLARTERKIPSQITFFAMLRYNGMPVNQVPLPENITAYPQDRQLTFIRNRIADHLNQWNGIVPYMGRITGYVYSPSYGVNIELDVNGNRVHPGEIVTMPPKTRIKV